MKTLCTCIECGYKWTSHFRNKKPSPFCSPMCETRAYYRERAHAMFDEHRKLDALEFTRDYLQSLATSP